MKIYFYIGLDMRRLSIDISPQQHQRLKAAAALRGKSIKEYVLERSLPDAVEKAAFEALESCLEERSKVVKGDE